MSTAGLVLCLSSGGLTRRFATTRRGSSSVLRFNVEQAETIFGREISVLEKYSSTVQYFIRCGEIRIFLASAGQLFGTPPQQVVDKVNEATSEMLLQWNTKLRTAQSWTELIAD